MNLVYNLVSLNTRLVDNCPSTTDAHIKPKQLILKESKVLHIIEQIEFQTLVGDNLRSVV